MSAHGSGSGPAAGPGRTVRVLVVDDEAPAREELARLLAAIPGVSVVGSVAVAAHVLPQLAQVECDLVLLDIRMPGQSGLAVAAEVVALDRPPHVAFVTAHDDHALEAFDREALDYILKPASPERLRRLVERVRARSARLPEVEALARAVGRRETPLLVGTLPGSARRVLVRPADLLYVEASDELVFLVTARGRTLATRSLQELEEALAAERFHRTHRSFLVNLDHVVEYEPDSSGTVHLRLDSGDARVPVSRRHWPELRRRLEGGAADGPDGAGT
jgi:two-component system LytT family response regulator